MVSLKHINYKDSQEFQKLLTLQFGVRNFEFLVKVWCKLFLVKA